MNDDVEKELAAYLGRKREERARGLTFEALFTTTRGLANSLLAHEKECADRWRKNGETQSLFSQRLSALETAKQQQPQDSSADITNVHDARHFAEAVKKAAIEGYIAKDSTPDEQIQRVLAEKEHDIEFRRLKRLEQQQKEEQDRKHKNRRYLLLGSVIGIVGGAGAVLAVDALHWLSSLHH